MIKSFPRITVIFMVGMMIFFGMSIVSSLTAAQGARPLLHPVSGNGQTNTIRTNATGTVAHTRTMGDLLYSQSGTIIGGIDSQNYEAAKDNRDA
ncbi:MAG TPA: hypothetical protein VHL11_03285, partial [Phototrophicaceae bacterium]|nr:hypothetical protein [Phototrophicaceae bacterium]